MFTVIIQQNDSDYDSQADTKSLTRPQAENNMQESYDGVTLPRRVKTQDSSDSDGSEAYMATTKEDDENEAAREYFLLNKDN